MSEKNQALAAAMTGVLASCFDAAEDKTAEEKAYRAGVLQMLMRCAVALESIAAGAAAARADAHAAASEDAAAMAGTAAGKAPYRADGANAAETEARPGSPEQQNVVTARLNEKPAEHAEETVEKAADPAPQNGSDPAEKTEAPAVVTARVEEQKEKAKKLEPRLIAQMSISEAYKNASPEKRETPLGSYIRVACVRYGWKSFGTVPEDKLEVLTAEVRNMLEN